jgi:hypothetical protein
VTKQFLHDLRIFSTRIQYPSLQSHRKTNQKSAFKTRDLSRRTGRQRALRRPGSQNKKGRGRIAHGPGNCTKLEADAHSNLYLPRVVDLLGPASVLKRTEISLVAKERYTRVEQLVMVKKIGEDSAKLCAETLSNQ